MKVKSNVKKRSAMLTQCQIEWHSRFLPVHKMSLQVSFRGECERASYQLTSEPTKLRLPYPRETMKTGVQVTVVFEIHLIHLNVTSKQHVRKC